jgi:hypothetical protein
MRLAHGSDTDTALDAASRSATCCVGRDVKGAGRHVAAFLPAAGAALVGGLVGFRKWPIESK